MAASNLKPLRYQKFDDLETELPNLKKYTVKGYANTSKAKSAEVRRSIYTISYFFCHCTRMRSLIKTASDIFGLAVEHQRDGDQELSYIQYHKFFNVVHYIRSTKDYASDTKYYNLMLGVPSKLKTAIEQMEVLNASLKRRYTLQNGIVGVGNNAVAPSSATLSAGDYGDRQIDRRKTPSPNRPSTTATTTATSNGRNNNGNTHSSANDAPSASGGGDIDVLAFVRLLQDKQTGVLVMDCRPAAEFEASRIAMAGVQALNVPAELVKPG